LGIVQHFEPEALEGAVGQLQSFGCRVWAANLYLHARTALGLKPMAQVACDDFNKKMYRHGLGVSTGFCGLHHVMPQAVHPNLNTCQAQFNIDPQCNSN
jgi:hypothetical protein